MTYLQRLTRKQPLNSAHIRQPFIKKHTFVASCFCAWSRMLQVYRNGIEMARCKWLNVQHINQDQTSFKPNGQLVMLSFVGITWFTLRSTLWDQYDFLFYMLLNKAASIWFKIHLKLWNITISINCIRIESCLKCSCLTLNIITLQFLDFVLGYAQLLLAHTQSLLLIMMTLIIINYSPHSLGTVIQFTCYGILIIKSLKSIILYFDSWII